MIRVQPIDGPWQRLGTDLYPGRPPEDVQPSWGASGPESLSFSLQRPPYRVHADLLPFTPVEYYAEESAQGPPDWSGYTMQAPPGATGEVTHVQCVGWHFYREDDTGPHLYVRDSLDGFQDARTIAAEDLTVNRQNASVQIDTTGIALTFAKGVALAPSQRAGVTLDLGAVNRVKQIVITGTWISTNPTGPGNLDANMALWVQLADYPNNFGLTSSQFTSANVGSGNHGTTFTLTATSSSLRRYVQIFVLHAFTGTCGFDIGAQITDVLLASDTSYIATGTSILTATTVIKDTVKALPLLSQDTSQITTTAFTIPSVVFEDDVTLRAVQDAVNDYHGYRLGVDASRRVFFRPQPAVPRLLVDARAFGVDYHDTSTNDGSDMYDYVHVRGNGGDGIPLRVDKSITAVAGANVASLPSVRAAANPDFTVDATGHTGSPQAVARTTGDFQVSPACGEISPWTSSTGQTLVSAMAASGTFTKGRQYRLRFWARVSSTAGPFGTAASGYVTYVFGETGSANHGRSSSNYSAAPGGVTGYGSWTQYEVTWTPYADVASSLCSVAIGFGARSGVIQAARIDNFTILEASSGILSRRNRSRAFTLTVAPPTDTIPMGALADAFLLAHRNVPFRGSLTVSAPAIIDLATQARVRPAFLGRYCGEMIRVTGVPDPNTGGMQSRDGIIASVQGTTSAQISIDSERHSLEALLARMGVITKVQ